MVVVHTFQQVDANCRRIRIISARKATKNEMKQYREEYK
ncbi:MAG: BrnT family toxin [Planctomycetes bacterium]|nr:BrnT family toxin [Planctomycetota bacterium]